MQGPVLIGIGSRRFADAAAISDGLFDCWLAKGPFGELWSGGAAGADTLCAQWAARQGLLTRVWPADWVQLGRSAGVRRSASMVAAAPAGSVVACFVPGALAASPGSAFTVSAALRRGLPVFLVVGFGPGYWLSPPEALLF